MVIDIIANRQGHPVAERVVVPAPVLNLKQALKLADALRVAATQVRCTGWCKCGKRFVRGGRGKGARYCSQQCANRYAMQRYRARQKRNGRR